jgi:hypothetical protein
MQDNFMQVQFQPFVKLAQANMELLSRFSSSPDVTTQAAANVSNLFQQATDSATSLMRSGAIAHLMEGMLKNYTVFLTELSQSSMAMMSQGQEAMTRQVQDATAGVVEATDFRKSRPRQVA